MPARIQGAADKADSHTPVVPPVVRNKAAAQGIGVAGAAAAMAACIWAIHIAAPADRKSDFGAKNGCTYNI